MSDKQQSRRSFLKATAGAATTVAIAGCGGEETTEPADTDEPDETDGPAETDEPDGTSTPDDSDAPFEMNGYPYGVNQTDVQAAKEVMEEAGYGPDNRYELEWLQYVSPAWKEMANTIRSRLESAYIDMNISDADFGPLLNTTKQGDHEAYTLGWVADYPAPQNFLQLLDPPNTDYSKSPTPNGARLFWTEDAQGDPAVREYMVEQFDRIQNNPENTDEATGIRNDAAVKLEEGMWESAALIPVYHQFSESFWYDHVDYQPTGGMGGSRAKTSSSIQGLDGKDRLSNWTVTFNSLDPIASGNTASGDIVMDLFDAPMNYVNGTTEVEGLLIEDYEVSDDLTTYTFTMKEGMQFHGDYGEVTADDVVYSFRRLVESDNSTNTYFPMSVLGIEHETETVTVENDEGEEEEVEQVVSGSTGVEATGDYEFEVRLESAFGYTLPVLAYSAFSVVPEGIVGDIEGYDGDMEYQSFSTESPTGSGPFEFVSWTPGAGGSVELDAFADYHDGEPVIDGIDTDIIVDPNAQYNYFINENADISGIPTEQYDPSLVSVDETREGGIEVGSYGPLENDKTVNYAGVPTIDTFYIGFNMEKVPKPVRQAMAYVVNQGQFVESVFKGRGLGAFHLEPPQVFPGGAEGYDSHYQG